MDIATLLSFIMTSVFLLIVLSYYWLLLRPEKRGKPIKFNSITIVVPAHNEELHIASCLNAIMDADFNGKKQIIVVDDGSRDETARIASAFPITLMRTKHQGKSKSINAALKKATGELVAIIDGDSYIAKDALTESLKHFDSPKVGVVCSTVKVENRNTFIGGWLHIEQLYNSLLRGLFSKINVSIVAPGPLSIYRRDVLSELNGFEFKGYSEDVDIAVRMIKSGYSVAYAENAVSETSMPVSCKGFWKQRRRFSKGWVNILKRHLRLNKSFIQIYTLPLALFWYLQAVIMGAITITNIASGYHTYFLSQGIIFNWYVVKFFVEWFSLIGIIHWFWNVVTGAVPLTIFTVVSLVASLLVYPLYLLAIIKYDRKITLRTILVLLFMFPFWFVLMMIYIISLPEYFRKDQKNIWDK